MSEHEASVPAGPAVPSGGGERRAVVRYPCGWHGPTRLIVRHGPSDYWARPNDVSVAGIRLLLAHPLEPAATLSIQVRGRPDLPLPPLAAAVVHARAEADGTWLVGCVFERMLTTEELELFL
jgi:hypothetical protein